MISLFVFIITSTIRLKGLIGFIKIIKNTGEYNGVVELINGALWLIEFHKINAEMNKKLAPAYKKKLTY